MSREDKLRVLAQEAVADLRRGEAFALCVYGGGGGGGRGGGRAVKGQTTLFAAVKPLPCVCVCVWGGGGRLRRHFLQSKYK